MTQKNMAALSVASALLLTHCAGGHQRTAPGTLTLLVYDKNGKALDYDAFAKACKGDQKGAYEADVFLDPETLKVTQWYPINHQASLKNIPIPDGRHALAFNWPTIRGYSFLILDNGGKGFSKRICNTEVNVTYQAAMDIHRQLKEALRLRKDYQYSASFTAACLKAKAHLDAAERAINNQRERGKQGALALDQLAVAYDLLLKEYGSQKAKKADKGASPVIGLTIEGAGTDESIDKANIDKAFDLTGTSGMVRIVFDPGKSLEDYKAIVAYAKSKNLQLLGEPLDSEEDKAMNTVDCLAHFKDCIDTFPEIDVWEVGNEVNGGWNSGDIAERVKYVADYVKSKGKKTLLTLFWGIGTGNPDPNSNDNTQNCATDLFTWLDSKLDSETREKIDFATLSVYPEVAPMGLCFERVMGRLGKEFPKAKTGLGELDYWCQEKEEENHWWYGDKKDAAKARLDVCDQYYHASLAIPNSMGGGFWWNFASTSSKANWTQKHDATLLALKNKLQ